MTKYNEMSDKNLIHCLYMYEKRLAVVKALFRKLDTCTVRISNDDIVRSLTIKPNGQSSILTDTASILLRYVIEDYENHLDAIYGVMSERNIEINEDNLCEAIDLYMMGD